MKNLRISIRRIASVIAALACVIGIIPSTGYNAKASTITGNVPITCYALSTGRTPTYHYSNGRYTYTGYIDAVDRCTIVSTLSNGYVRVKYPVKRGYRTEYARASAFFVNENFSIRQCQFGRRLTVYTRNNLSQYLGEVYANDNCIIIGCSGNTTQLLYPVQGGYKLGFVSGRYSISDDDSDGRTRVYPANGYYRIKSATDQRYVLDVYDNSQADCANIELWENNGGHNQVFYLEKQGDGSYIITAKHSGKVLDCDNNGTSDGTNIIQYSRHGGTNQRWYIEKTSDGYYSFRNLCNNKCLDANNADAYNGVNIQCWTANNTTAQKYVLEPCSDSGNSQSQNNNKRQEIVNYELSQLGVSDYRGNNNVIYNTWFYGRTVRSSGYAWCMAFQAYCANQTGVLNSAIPKTTSCSTAVNYYKSKGQFRYRGSYTPQAGDLVFYGPNGGSHVGMIVGAPVNGYLQVVEGNVYQSNGNYSVQRFTRNQKRRVDSSYVYGYGVPAY